ncbi:MAG: class I SAM-dependent methyltransferase [Pseudomonadota bacterium]|nr:class I SAM-dependent methyltransferase [Pseudomonadota bacterium]
MNGSDVDKEARAVRDATAAATGLGAPDADSAQASVLLPFPPGHFYSPIVDPAAIDAARIWPADPHVCDIDFADASHVDILTRALPRFRSLYDYPDRLSESETLQHFFTHNSQFSWLDPHVLFALLHDRRPRRVIEVGSGFSSLLLADVNERFFGGRMNVTCIEPYPRPFLAKGLPGITELLTQKVQDVGVERFTRLAANDILFIDSSHVAKTGSDVNFIFFEVLPRLSVGVLVHLHDIFLPHDYPPDWVLGENRSWNEQYLLRAMLQGGTRYEVVFGCSYAFHRHRELVIAALDRPDGAGYGGGSFWIRKRD